METGGAREVEQAKPWMEERPLFQGRILVVDDNAINRKVALGILSHMGLAAQAAESGPSALEQLERESFQLVLMDVQMPDMDGYETTHRIRTGGAGEQNRQIAIVAMTAHAMQGDRELCLQAGMDDYVAKPIRRQELARVLRAAEGRA